MNGFSQSERACAGNRRAKTQGVTMDEVSNEFGTEVLFESETSIVGVMGQPWVEEWLLAVPGGGIPTVVTVVDTADGVDVAGGESPAPAL